MRYMFLISAAETGAQPPASLMDAIEKLAEDETATQAAVSDRKPWDGPVLRC